jgi:hypothetical protein
LFPQVRQGVLAATLGQPEKWWCLSAQMASRPEVTNLIQMGAQSVFRSASIR